MVERDTRVARAGDVRVVPPPVPPRNLVQLENVRLRRPWIVQERQVVELLTVREDVRVGVGREAELPLSDKAADLGPCPSLPV